MLNTKSFNVYILYCYLFFLSIRFLDILIGSDFLIQGLYVIFSLSLYFKIYFENTYSFSKPFFISFILLFLILLWLFFYLFYLGLNMSTLLSNLTNYSSLILIAFLSQKSGFFDKYFNTLGFVLTITLLIYFLSPKFSNYFVVGIENGSIIENSNRYCSVFNSPGYLSFYAVGLLVYSLHSLFNKINFKNLIFYTVSIVSGILTLNRLFLLLLLIVHFLFFLFYIKKIRKIAFLLTLIFVLFLLGNFVFGSYLIDLIDIFIFRFDSGFDNRLSGESGIEYSLKSIYNLSFFFGKLDNIKGELWININGNLEQPHNAFIFYLVGFGFFPFLLIFFLYILRLKDFLYHKNDFLTIFLISILFCSITEIFLIEQLNILILFTSIKKYKYNNDFF